MTLGREVPGDALRPVLDELYRSHRQRLYAFAWARTRSREDALDLVQEVFLRAWRHMPALAERPGEARLYWLFACARRLSIDHQRHRQVVARTERAPDGEPADAGRGDPVRRAEAAETWRLLDTAIRALPAALREVLALSVLGEMTSAQIGVALGIPAGTVRYQLLQARRALRRALAVPAPDPGRGGR